MGTSLQPVRVEELLGQLHSPWFWRRWRAVRGLRQFPEPRVVEAVCSALDDPVWWVQRQAVVTLGELGGEQAVEALCRLLLAPSRDLPLRYEAAQALGRWGNERAVGPLCATLKARSPRLRRAAAEALGRLWERRAVSPLTATLREVRGLAHRLSAGPKTLQAEPALQRLQGQLRRAAQELVRSKGYAAEQTLNQQVRRALCAALKEPSLRVRNSVILALGSLGDAQTIEPLMKLYQAPEGNHHRVELRDALQRTIEQVAQAPTEGDLDPLLQVLSLRVAYVQEVARDGLLRLVEQLRQGEPEWATPPLVKMLGTPDDVLRLRVVQALARVGDHRALGPLETQLRLWSNVTAPEVKTAAAAALEAIRQRVGAHTGRELSRARPPREWPLSDAALSRAEPAPAEQRLTGTEEEATEQITLSPENEG